MAGFATLTLGVGYEGDRQKHSGTVPGDGLSHIREHGD